MTRRSVSVPTTTTGLPFDSFATDRLDETVSLSALSIGLSLLYSDTTKSKLV